MGLSFHKHSQQAKLAGEKTIRAFLVTESDSPQRQLKRPAGNLASKILNTENMPSTTLLRTHSRYCSLAKFHSL
jgi:hypothetical protein